MNTSALETPSPGSDRLYASGVFAAAACFLMWTASAAGQWYDTAEFGAVGWWLSASHPPGHPLHATLSHGVGRLFLGDVAYRANIFSGLCVAGALAVAYTVFRRLAPRVPRYAVAAAALAPAFMSSVWLQGVRAEVYGLQLLLTAVLARLCLDVARGDDARSLPLLAAVFGLAGANHSYLGLLFVPLALWAMAVGRPSLRAIVWAAGAGLTTLLTYAYLPLRAGLGGEIGWGRVDSLESFWATLSGQAWSTGLIPAPADTGVWDHVGTLLGYTTAAVGPFGLTIVLLLIAAAAVPMVRERRHVALAVALAVVLPFASRAPYPVDTLNPDLGGYLAGAFVALMGLACVALDALPRVARVHLVRVLPILLALCVLRFDAGGRVDTRSAEVYGRALLAEVPPDGVLVYSDYGSTFQGWSLRAAEGARPNVALVFRGQVGQPWQAARLARSHPAVARRLSAFPEGFSGPENRYEPGVNFASLGALASRLGPQGFTLSTAPPRPLSAVKARLSLVDRFVDIDGRRYAAFIYAQHLAHLSSIGAPDSWLDWFTGRLATLAPGDPLVEALVARRR